MKLKEAVKKLLFEPLLPHCPRSYLVKFDRLTIPIAELFMLDDGLYVCEFYRDAIVLPSYVLRDIADKIDELNKEQEKFLIDGLSLP